MLAKSTRTAVPALRGSRRAGTARSSSPALVVRCGVRRVTRSGQAPRGRGEGRARSQLTSREQPRQRGASDSATDPPSQSATGRVGGATCRRYTQRQLGAHSWVRSVGVLLSSVPTVSLRGGGDRPHPAHARRDHDGTATRQVTSVAGEAGGWVALRRGCAILADRQPGTLAGHSRLVAPPAPCDSIRAGSGGVGSLLAWRVMPTERDHPE